MSEDVEVFNEPVAPVAQVPVTPAVDTSETSATHEENALGRAKTEQPKPKGGGFQRRIDELVREREEAKADRQKLLDIIAARETGKTVSNTEVKPAEDEPKLEKFDSYEKYLSAHARWSARQELAEQRRTDEAKSRKEQEEQAARTQGEQAAKRQKEFNGKIEAVTEKGEKKYPDFYEKTRNPDLKIPPYIAEAAMDSDLGEDVLYHLATNPKEADRLASLTPTRALVEFGKLEDKIAAKKKEALANPINPVTGKAGISGKPSSSDDMATWMAKRNKQLGRK